MDEITRRALELVRDQVHDTGNLLAHISNETRVKEYFNSLVSAWPGDNLDQVCTEPEFIRAVAITFHQVLKAYLEKAKH